MSQVSPMGALLRGMCAGALGSAAQSAFFKLTAPLAPKSPPGAFDPPEAAQKNENQTETVARRLVEKLAQRGPLDAGQKQRAGKLVHYGFGAMWGGLYGLARESAPVLDTPLGVAAFSAGVWALGDNALLELFKIAGPPNRYPPKVHAFALAGHLAYGAGLWAGYQALRPRSLAAVAAGLWALNTRRKLRRYVPRPMRPAAKTAIDGFARLSMQRPFAQA